MNKLKVVSLQILLIFLGGCVLSLEPFYTRDSVIEIPELDGKWHLVDSQGNPENEKSWDFQGNEIITFDHMNRPGLLSVTYFKNGGLIFADTISDEPKGMHEIQLYHIIIGHMVSRIDIEGNHLIVRPLNVTWFNRFIQEHKFVSCVITEEYTTHVFNASSEDWVDFLEMYGTDDGAFPKEGALEFIRQDNEKENN